MASWKGKEKVVSGKDDKTGGRKRKDRGVLHFFDDTAFELDGSDESSDDDFGIDDFLEDEFENDVKSNNEPAKAPLLPFIKEEEMNEEELERMVEERYGPGSSFVTYAEDGYESKRSSDRVAYPSSSRDPTLWKAKCVVGRERHSTFCLMQKFVDLRSLGTKLQIISAFTLDHVKGFIYIEADKQNDVYEACKGLTNIYSSRVVPVPKNEISHVLSVRSKSHGITEGMWARVKNGKYKGDLAQVVAVNDARKKVTVKLIPRIDLRALAEKFGGGVTTKKASTPAPRLISSSELEEFRPLIQVRRDRDTNKTFQVLDGMMLKDGYLYKKVSIDSLSLWGAVPTEDELLKFEPSNYDESNDLEWLSDLYGDRKKKRVVMSDKGAGKGKGKGSPSSSIENNFEVHDLVFFGRKDFGVIIGMEKDDFKIMKEGSEGPLVVTLPFPELKSALFDKKLFTALDQHKKTISVNDTVRVLDGPLKDRQGNVKRIYRGTIFIYNESVEEYNGYICIKSHKCERVTSADESHENDNEPGPSGFGDFSSSPKSPLSPKKSWQGRDKGNFNREDKDGIFSVGQSLRIRVGPLKGYLCRVLAIRRSDVTVKLDSQQKILTVKMEHLSEVRGKSSAATLGEDQESVKPFDLLGTTGGSGDWMAGAGTTVESRSWNIGGSSTEGSGWPAFPASNHSGQLNSGAVIPSNTVDGDAEKGDSAWSIKPTSQSSAWGAVGVDEKTVADTAQGWNKAASTSVVATGTSDSWGKAVESRHENISQGTSWGRDGENSNKKDDSSLNKVAWGSAEPAMEKQTGTWGNAGQPEESGWKIPAEMSENKTESWANKQNDAAGTAGWGNDGSSWGKTVASQDSKQGGSSWGKHDGGSSLNKKESGSSWSKPAGGSSWAQKTEPNASASKGRTDQNDSWGKQDGGSSWGKPAGGSSWGQKNEQSIDASKGRADQKDSWGKQEGGSSWSKPAGGSSWGQKAEPNANALKGRTDQNDSWGKQQGGSSWSKPAGGSTWGQQADATAEDQSKGKTNQNESWNKMDGGSSWNNQAASSWNAPKSSAGALSSDWSTGSGTNDETGGGSGWGTKSNRNSGKASNDNSSAWNQKSVGNMKDEEKQDHGDGWNVKKTSEGGSSSGWGQSTQWNSGVESAGGNQNSAWSSKGNWSAGNDFGGSQEQSDNSYRGRGRGGSWKGGWGGRGESDRSGFGGGDGSERGGFGGRDGSESGGFGGRGGSERGGFGGRGRTDRGGFRGRGRSDRGGFGGRGRGRSDQSGEDKPQSWSKSNNGANGGGTNENRGSWNQGGGDEGKGKSWSSGGFGNNENRGSWNSADGGGNKENKGSWNQGGSDNGKWKSWTPGGSQSRGDTDGGGNAQAGWSTQEKSWKTKDSTGGWNDQKPGYGEGSTSRSGSAAGTWNTPSGSDWGQAKQGNGAAEGEGPANEQAGWSKKESSWKTTDATGSWNQGTSRSGSNAVSWSKPSGSNAAGGEGPADSWGKAASSSSWGKSKDGGW